jgi:predicted transcriptional regulator
MSSTFMLNQKKNIYFLCVQSDILYMQRSTTFAFSDTFKARLEELATAAGKTRTAIIVDAVNAYASGTLPDKKIVDLLHQLSADNAAIKQSLDDNRALLMAILKELQQS